MESISTITTASMSDNPFKLFPRIDPEADIGHTFYLGVETARAEIAFRHAKRYAQDEPLSFGVAAKPRNRLKTR